MPENNQYLTRAELADRWKMSRSRLSSLASSGRSPVPYIRIAGGQVLYPIQAVEAYEAQLLAEADAA